MLLFMAANVLDKMWACPVEKSKAMSLWEQTDQVFWSQGPDLSSLWDFFPVL